MRRRPLPEQVWKHGSVHYKIIKVMSDGSMEVLMRNGPVGRWSSKPQILTPSDLNYLEFVKAPPNQVTLPEEPEEGGYNTRRAIFQRTIPKRKRYVITYAQNATPIHTDFFKTLQVYCKENQAELIIIPGRYRNPTSVWSSKKSLEWWEKELHPYLISKRVQLRDDLIIYSDISIQPTAVRPLTGMEVFTGKASAIFGHPKIQLLTVATNSRRSKLMTTTGSCTILNYTCSKAGKKAAAHHVFGATIVEMGKTGFHIRQINANSKTGSFTDLDWVYTVKGKEKAPPAEALILGDVHANNVDEKALKASFDMIDALKCKRAIYHDLLDFDVRNHHSIDDFRDRYRRVFSDDDTADIVEAELEQTVEVLESTPACAEPVVIQSNHDEAFDRWLDTANPKNDPLNALLFHKMWVTKLEEFNRTGNWKTAFSLYYKLSGYKRAIFIGREENYPILGIECGYHGDKGTNGSRGSSLAYAKLGVKTIIGHRHTPSIVDGCYTVGVIGKLNQGYNDLPSSWAHANCVIYANGKRSLLFIQPETGEWKI